MRTGRPIAAVSSLLALFLSAPRPARAQGPTPTFGSPPATAPRREPPKKDPPKAAKRTVAIQPKKTPPPAVAGNRPKPVAAPVTPSAAAPPVVTSAPKNGALVVLADAQATVTLKREGRNEAETSTRKDNNYILFNDLVPGIYKVTAELGEVSSAPLQVEIKKGPPETLDLRLTGDLTVAAQPGARIKVTADNKVLKEEIVPAGGSLIFKDLVTDDYVVSANLSGYRETSQPVNVPAQETASLAFTLEPITYDVALKLNVPSGTVRYTNSEEKSGKWEMYSFQGNHATLPKMRPGSYQVIVETSDASYLPRTLNLNLPADSNLSVDLAKKSSTETFLGTGDWRMTGTDWKAAAGKVSANGAGWAWPQDEKFRNYNDFQVVTAVRLLTGKSVSLILRAQDEKNYYRLAFTGPGLPGEKGPTLNFQSFIAQNGEEKPFGSKVSMVTHSQLMGPDKVFYIAVTVSGAQVRVNLAANKNAVQSGEWLKITLPAPLAFTNGAVGLFNAADSKFEAKEFQVQPINPQP